MSSESAREAFVWIWLPGESEPVVAGRVEEAGGEAAFIYGQSYLRRPDAISLYSPELPLVEERIRPLPGLDAPGCILDARPDAWGLDVIRDAWDEVCDQAELEGTSRDYFWKRQFLNDYALEGWPA